MFRRVVALVVAAAAVSPAVAEAGSLVVDSARRGDVEIRGVGCGTSSSVSVPLPATATDITVREPDVGDRGVDSRITEAAPIGTAVRITAIGDSQELCDPSSDPDLPPAQRIWSDFYGYDIRFRERVSAAYWQGAEKPRILKAKPRKVTIPRVAHGIKIRWKRIGGRKAVGFGRIKAIPPPRVRCTYFTCPGHGARMKVVLTRPSRCPELGDTVFYAKVAFYMRERARFLKRGELYSYFRPGCAFVKPTPV